MLQGLIKVSKMKFYFHEPPYVVSVIPQTKISNSIYIRRSMESIEQTNISIPTLEVSTLYDRPSRDSLNWTSLNKTSVVSIDGKYKISYKHG